jgi:tRNA-2-methylthio-N6-dimethylallyladenosine synthase
MTAVSFPKMRIRFSTSIHKICTKVCYVIAKHPNICKHIHLPVQSGSNRILKEMNRLHSREEYMTLIDKIRAIIPNGSISQDMIAGFPPTEQDKDTLSLMEYVKYNFGYMYSLRTPRNISRKKMDDDVTDQVKAKDYKKL